MTKKFTLISMRFLSVLFLLFTLLDIFILFHFENGNKFYITLPLSIISLVIIYGIWRLKRWTLFLYLLTCLSFQVYNVIIHSWKPTLLILPIIYISIISINYKNLN